ncbi:hypothetical protein DCO48_18300 [Pseudomonas sp. SDI]|uniref:hypothetical protein n=1 Tax=Pseudomonas sp. SDI TaxID=2170734 RepID=UPI000DE65BFF|nr:hypothetical protein [Pseudomonas sp. SDI]PWB31117.1 hypothetical protein DCO48_18300 [Pseudomonas sp. SDI]
MNARRLLPWLGVVLCATAWMGWDEFDHRRQLDQRQPVLPASAVATPARPFDAGTIALAFAASASVGALATAEQLTLQAVILGSEGDSRVLIGATGKARFYRVGERLPDGSVVRRIEARQALLWQRGHEQRVSLAITPSLLIPTRGNRS